MESQRRRLSRFLCPMESDGWLAVLRIGLGLQVLLYALSLRRDWNYLLAGTDGGMNGRALSEALLSSQSPLVPRLGWSVTIGSGDSSTVVRSCAPRSTNSSFHHLSHQRNREVPRQRLVERIQSLACFNPLAV